MRKIKAFLFFLCLGLASFNSYSQTWYWTSQADSSASQTASQVTVDRNDNPYYTGYFSGTRMSFGSFGITNVGSQSDFLVKYTTNGAPIWARNSVALTAGATTYGISIATDRNNDVIESGYFSDSIAFGSYHLSSYNTFENSYLVKYDGNGNVLWATTPRIVTGGYYNQNYAVVADKQNNIYLAGYYEDSVVFGNDTLTSTGTDMYLVKYNPSGHVIWARTATLSNGGSVYGLSVAADDSGNAYISGNISDSASFGSIKIGNNGNATIYLAKYDSSGHAKWVINTHATPGQILPTPVSVDKSNNVYLGAQFNNPSLNFGAYTVTDGASPCSNALLAKFDGNGNAKWATCADFISMDEVCVIIESAVATDRCNNVYWSGLCSDTFGVGAVKVTVTGGASHPSKAFAYVIKLDSNANPIAGAALANQNGNSFSNYLAVDSLSKALFVSELVTPATLIVGSDTVKRYLSNSTCFLSKFAVIPSIVSGNNNSDSICYGDSILLSIVPVSGTTYTWSNGATTSSTWVAPHVTTTYSLTTNNGCIIDTSFVKVVVAPPIFPVVHINPDTICKGDTALLTATGATSYRWSTGATTSGIKVAPLTTATYTLTATNGGCSMDTVVIVNVSALPTASITATPADSVCVGDSVLLSGSGGSGFKWSDGSTATSIWVSPTVVSSYTLHITNGALCSDSSTIKIKIIPVTTATVTAVNDTICPFDTATLTATGLGGTVTYLWSNGKTTSTIKVNPSSTTTYTSTVVGACNTVINPVTVTVVPLPVTVISGTTSKCKGAKDTLKVSGATTYLWSNGSTTSTYYTGDINADSTITVIGYNSRGCADTAKFNITVAPAPGVSITYTPTCLNNPVEVVAEATGSGNFTYSWSPGGQTTDSIIVNDSNQTYTVRVSNGCVVSKSINLTYDNPTFNACCDKVILEGSDTIITASGSDIKSYTWTPSTGLNCDTCATVTATPTTTTTYTIIATDSLGCQTERLVTITVELPCFNFTVPNVFTPNYEGASGVNNVFYIKTENITNWSISIFDRWGKEMFTSTNPNNYWPGTTMSGGQASDGVYYYIISGSCQSNTYKRDGFVQLIR